jgi:hypothetical protein
LIERDRIEQARLGLFRDHHDVVDVGEREFVRTLNDITRHFIAAITSLAVDMHVRVPYGAPMSSAV